MLRGNFDGLLEENGAGVEALFKEHGGVAGKSIAHGHRPLDGRGAAVLGQQRRVEVDAAEPWEGQHPGGDDAAIGYDDDGVGGDGLKLGVQCGVVADFFWLRDGEAGCECGLLDRRSGELLAAANGAVGLRDNQRNLMTCREQSFEGGNGEAGGAAEDELQGRRHAATTRPRAASCGSCAD